MGETILTWKPTCNPSVSIQLSGRKTSSDGGAFLLREVMDRSGICEQLGQQLQDHRDPSKVRHSLTSQLRTLMIQHAQGWDDLSDTQLLGEDPVFQLACSDQRSTTPLTQQRPSQPTLSRLLNLLAQDANRAVLHDGLLDLAVWRLSSMRGGKPLPSITLDVDGLPIETFGNQAGTGYNRYVGCTHYSPRWPPSLKPATWWVDCYARVTVAMLFRPINGFPGWFSGYGKPQAPRYRCVLILALPAVTPCQRWMQQTSALLAA